MSTSFPILDDKTLFSSLFTLGVRRPQDLKTPTEQTVKQAFLELLTEFTGESVEDIQNLHPECVHQAGIHPDCYAKASSEMTLYLLIFQLLHKVGVPKISLNDITQPKYDRLRVIFSAVVNFAKAYVNSLDCSDHQKESIELLSQENSQLAITIDALKEELIQLEDSEETAYLRQLKAEVMELEGEYNSLRDKRRQLEEITDQDRKELATVNDLVKEISAELQQYSDEEAHLRTKVISPSLSLEVETLKREHKAIQAQYSRSSNRLSGLRRQAKAIERVIKTMDDCHLDLEEALALAKLVRAKNEEYEDDADRRTAAKAALDELVATRNQLTAQIVALTSTIEDDTQTSKTQLTHKQKELQTIHQSRAKVEKQHRLDMAEIEATEKTIWDLEAELEALKTEHEAQLLTTHTRLAVLEEAMDQFHHQTLEEMK